MSNPVQAQSQMQTVRLGKTGIQVSQMGIGTWAWGDWLVWGYGRGGYSDEDLRNAFQRTLDTGINLFDTAEVYGLPTHRSEKLLGRFLQAHASLDNQARPVIATKFYPFPWRVSRRQLLSALRGSLKRLRLSQVDLYQIHVSGPPMPIETWAEALGDAVEAGLTRSVGVSNYSTDEMRRAHDILARRNIPLASNQVEYSLLHRDPEGNGLLAACKELDITLIAYSPLAMGLLTGKYTADHKLPWPRGSMYSQSYVAAIQPLIGRLREIGQAHGNKTPAQIALNWTLCKGTLPIPGAKNVRQVEDNASALGWHLSDEEVAQLEAATDAVMDAITH